MKNTLEWPFVVVYAFDTGEELTISLHAYEILEAITKAHDMLRFSLEDRVTQYGPDSFWIKSVRIKKLRRNR